MFIRILNLGLTLVIAQISYSQTTTTSYGESNISDLMLTSSLNKKQLDIKYNQVKGSPYNVEEFVKSDIFFKNGRIITAINTRLNLFDNNLEFQRDGQYYILNNPENIEKISINNEEFLFNQNDDDEIKRGFYSVKIKGKFQLLSSIKVIFKEAKIATNSYTEDIPSEFIQAREKYFLGYMDEVVYAFGNKKNFQDSFAHSHISLVEYAKKNRLNPKKYADLVKMVNYLNAGNDISTN